MSRGVTLAAVGLLLALGGCSVSRGVAKLGAIPGSLGFSNTSQKITTRDEFASVKAGRPITVYAQGERVYQLPQHALGDTLIRGSGTLQQGHDVSPFTGTIPFREIIAVKTDSRSAIKGFALLGITALFVAYAIEASDSHHGMQATEQLGYRYPGGGVGTSCPYLYAWDGARYELQAEPFGTAWGRALEQTTLHVLPAVRAGEGEVRLRLTNERAETHYVNSIQLRAIDLGTAPAAVLDGEGRAWPLSRPVSPVTARDKTGRDILPEVADADGRMWECDPSGLTPGSGYEDVLEVAFARPRHASAGSLVLTGINTEISSVMHACLCRLTGDQTALFAHAVETDPELIAGLREYLRDASLKAFVWDGRGWQPAGEFQPEASAVSFTRALRIGFPDGVGDTVRVRLRGMADVWKIDALSADWGGAQPLPMTPVKLLSATGPAGEDLLSDLEADDARYAILLPPDQVDLTFAAGRLEAGRRLAYAAAGRGYLLEWDLPLAEKGSASLASLVPEAQRIEFVKELLRHRELALQPMYEEWRKVRARDHE